MKKNINWEFPLPRTHTGIMLGNATTGLLVWGEKATLKITIGRADLWDHRGGMPWTDKQNYHDIKKALEANDAEAIKEIFACETENTPGQPERPSVIPVGRLDLQLGENAELKSGELDIKTGIAEVIYTRNGAENKIVIQISMKEQVFLIQLPDPEITIEEIPSWDFKGEYLAEISFEPPTQIDNEEFKGWTQKLPEDPGVSVAYIKDNQTIGVITSRDENIVELREKLNSTLKETDRFHEENRQWWEEYLNKVPEISIPNDTLDFIYRYGLYKFACFTNPAGIAASLQGPWVEEYELPPWSDDYHFNINVQMCYWPAYKANCPEHLKPIFDLVWSWKDKLRANAKAFIGVDDGFMLPHAVDDHCVCMGSFWTGTIDHACSAWMAQMMYSYYKHTDDRQFLKEIAYPFMKGVMRVYEAMLEKTDGKYCLPVSVSPEYRGAAMDAWGINASFQLGAVHRLCEDLIDASEQLDTTPLECWKDILERLPKTTLIGNDNDKRIALWEGTDLEESHRHHSHLAAICPFDTIDIYAEEWQEIIANTIDHWVKKGMGLWSGWCVPWASMIHSRLGNGDMAEMLLEIWERVFTNQGYGTLHDADFLGLSIMGAPGFCKEKSRYEIMQMDAGMGAVTAVQDMLIHNRRGVEFIFPGIPKSWKNVSFIEMPVEGGFLISASKKDGKIDSISIRSKSQGTLKLANPWGNRSVKGIVSNGNEISLEGQILEITLSQEDTCDLNNPNE